MPENENLLLRLHQSVDGCGQTQQELREFVLNDPAKVVYLTITELTRESGTNETSVTRLCRTLGCKGYNEFKMALALDLRQVQSVGYGGDETDSVVNESVQALQDTAKLLDRILLGATAPALRQAQSVQIYDVTANATLGEYLHYKLLRPGKPVQLFSGVHHAAINATTPSKSTFVVAISSSGSTRNLLHIVRLARKRSVRILTLSSTPRSPLASLSDIRLVAAKSEDPLNAGALNAKVGVMLSVELLTASLIALSHKHSGVNQQTADTTLPLLL